MSKKSVYFGAGWFNDKQLDAYNKGLGALKLNESIDETRNYVPLEHQFGNEAVSEHPELLQNKEWAVGTFNGDILGINQTDVALFIYLPSEEDVGCGVEMGYAYANAKPIVVVIPDDEWGKPINLMSFGTGTAFVKLSQLKDFDFNRIEFNFYEGEVY